jgi:catechol 2,3-dioxygenase-like lactoylglutathione lyase family enzyme
MSSAEEGAMAVQLNHTIVNVRDKRESATFLAEILGLDEPTPFGPFLVVQVDNDVSLDFADDHGPVRPQHYAFLVGESEFDEIFGRIRARGLPYWADPGRRRSGEINTNDGGRGVYWEDPSGHFLEIITRPYGSEG